MPLERATIGGDSPVGERIEVSSGNAPEYLGAREILRESVPTTG